MIALNRRFDIRVYSVLWKYKSSVKISFNINIIRSIKGITSKFNFERQFWVIHASQIQDKHDNETKTKDCIKSSQLNLPKSVKFRTRQHVNPLNNFDYEVPSSPESIDWSFHFPLAHGLQNGLIKEGNTSRFPSNYNSKNQFANKSINIDILDIGWGYGSLLLQLSMLYQNDIIFGMEIREKVTDYVIDKINVLRSNSNYKQYMNVSAVRTNAMKCLPNYIHPNSLSKIFVCFPDPYFKTSQFKRRIINTQTVNEIVNLLKPNGRIYTVTDVHNLHLWNLNHLSNNKQLVKVTEGNKSF